MSIEFLWPRGLLLACSVLYGTNFPLGKLMNEGTKLLFSIVYLLLSG